jgi:hypothetical protein
VREEPEGHRVAFGRLPDMLVNVFRLVKLDPLRPSYPL